MVFKADTGSKPVPFKTLVMTTGALACFLRSKKWEKKIAHLQEFNQFLIILILIYKN